MVKAAEFDRNWRLEVDTLKNKNILARIEIRTGNHNGHVNRPLWQASLFMLPIFCPNNMCQDGRHPPIYRWSYRLPFDFNLSLPNACQADI